MASGVRTSQNTYTLDNIPAQLNVPAITGPKRYNEAITSVGNLTEIGTPVVVETPISQTPVAPIKPELYGPSNDQ